MSTAESYSHHADAARERDSPGGGSVLTRPSLNRLVRTEVPKGTELRGGPTTPRAPHTQDGQSRTPCASQCIPVGRWQASPGWGLLSFGPEKCFCIACLLRLSLHSSLHWLCWRFMVGASQRLVPLGQLLIYVQAPHADWGFWSLGACPLHGRETAGLVSDFSLVAPIYCHFV